MARTLLKRVKAKGASNTMPLSHWHREAKEVVRLMKKTSEIAKCDTRLGIPTVGLLPMLGHGLRLHPNLFFAIGGR